jgi:hypothetical protein
MKTTLSLASAILLVALSGCGTPPAAPQTSLELQSIQSKDFSATKQGGFDATLSVLQDAGYVIESADFNSGFITGKAPTKSNTDFWYGAMNKGGKVTATISVRNENTARIRLNFVAYQQRKSTWNPSQDVINESPITEPALYQKVFAKIEEALFIAKASK